MMHQSLLFVAEFKKYETSLMNQQIKNIGFLQVKALGFFFLVFFFFNFSV
jgi:hypothetical protein